MSSNQILLLGLFIFTIFSTSYVFLIQEDLPVPKYSYSKHTLKDLSLKSMVHRDTSIFITPLPSCNHTLLDILVVVGSAVENFGARQAIRSTWGNSKNLGHKVKLLFLVGRSEDELSDRFIKEEKMDYFDILHYDFLDTYLNLTLKTFVLLEWFTLICNNARYVMKVDDDTFVNITNLRKELNKVKNQSKFLLGQMITDAKPVKDSSAKFYIPDTMFNKSIYPKYLSGSGYVMSREVIPELRQIAMRKPYMYFEDVFFTGICTMDTTLPLIHSKLFSYMKSTDFCLTKKYVTTHKLSPKEMRLVWQTLHQNITCVPFLSKIFQKFYIGPFVL